MVLSCSFYFIYDAYKYFLSVSKKNVYFTYFIVCNILRIINIKTAQANLNG